MHTEKMKTKFGNDSKDQVIVHDGDRRVFVSYGTPIAEIAGYGGAVTLDKDYWDYSVTTGQYRNEFLGEGIADTRKKIKDGTYQLTNLAPRKANKAGDYVINWPEAGAEAARDVEDDEEYEVDASFDAPVAARDVDLDQVSLLLDKIQKITSRPLIITGDSRRDLDNLVALLRWEIDRR